MQMRKMIALTGVAGLFFACQGGEQTPPVPPTAPAVEPAQPAPAPAAEAAEPAGEPGTLKVTVAFDGAAPKMDKLDRKHDHYCAKTAMTNETVLVNKNKTLKNVVVRLAKGVKGKFDVPTTAVEIDQQQCMYRPRVQTAMVGQTVRIVNGDQTLHNVHTYKGAEQASLFNMAQPPKGKPLEKTFTEGGEIITFRCDVHPWMAGYIALADHPFQGITGDDGAVTLAQVPAKKYTVEVWHEKYGVQSAEVTVEAGKTTEVTLTYKADQAAN